MDPFVKLARVPRRPPAADVVAAAALTTWALLEAVLGTGPGSTPARIGFALVVSVPLVVRRRAPLAVALLISAATVAWALNADRPESGTAPFPSLLFVIFSAALYARTTATAVLGGLIPVAAMTIALHSTYNSGRPDAGTMAILVFFCAGAWAAGWLVHRHALQARRAYAESDELARSAVAEERARIARELHDIVAHSVSIIAVQAGAAEEQLETDRDAAREHLGAVRRTAREAMNEMRRLLEVLREEGTSYTPQPGLARLPELLDEVRRAGVPVEIAVRGEERQLPAAIDLVAFRVVQESLTNVRRHGGGAPARVAIRFAPADLEVEVTNELAAASASNGGGHGLIGMRERVRIFEGDFEAGERPEGGFRVRVRLPLDEEAG